MINHEIIEMGNEIEFLTNENKMLTQKVNALKKQNEELELKVANLMASYMELRTKCTDIFGNQ